MDTGRHLPRYYVAKGIPVPQAVTSRPGYAGGLYTEPGCGPDVTSDDPDPSKRDGGGGMVFGGVCLHGERGWVPYPDALGVWANFAGVLPQFLIRMRTDPRVLSWTEVRGAEDDHVWRVPVLLRPVSKGQDLTIYLSALDSAWNGTDLVDDGPLAILQQQIFQLAHNIQDPANDQGSMAAVGDIVCAGLAIGHQVSRADIIAARWLTARVIGDIVAAMIGHGG